MRWFKAKTALRAGADRRGAYAYDAATGKRVLAVGILDDGSWAVSLDPEVFVEEAEEKKDDA